MDTEFFQLFEKERLSLMKLVYNYFRSPHDAADALQEALIQAYKYYQNGTSGRGHFRAWIHRLTFNVCHSIARKHYSTRRVHDVPVPNINRLAVAEEIRIQSSNSEFDDLFELVDELPDHHRQVIILRFVYKLNLQEIAQVEGIPVGTVKSRLNGAIKALRKKLNEIYGENLAV